MILNFRLTFPIISFSERINYENKIFSIGSCFSQNIAEKLLHYKFDIFTNPFGITYNPLSIAAGLERILDNKLYTEDELFFYNELWSSYDHHSDFSNASKEIVLKNINEQLEKSRTSLLNATTIIITLGTAYYYQLNETQKIVNNCHKIPQKNFTHKSADSAAIVKSFSALIEAIRKVNAAATFIFTVSPVRHRNLSAEKNTLSKAHLIVACHELCDTFKSVAYFPSYELMMDDLRDYRFYKTDMIHPNELAVDYIFEKFVAACIDEKSLSLMQQIEQLKNNLSHRPRNAASESYREFLNKQLVLIDKLSSINKAVNFDEERMQIAQQLSLFN